MLNSIAIAILSSFIAAVTRGAAHPHHHSSKHRRQKQTQQKQRHLQDEICSCSPTSFTATLDLLNSCFDDTLSDNIGIDDTDCTIEVGDPTSSSLAIEESLLQLLEQTNMSNGIVDNKNIEEVNDGVDDINKKRRLHQQYTTHNEERTLQDSPTRITSITFISFLEIDRGGTVVNVDENSDNLQDGDSVEFTSISNNLVQGVDIDDQLELVPNTQVLFMSGQNESGEVVRGRFLWRYTNSCDTNARTIEENDEIAWVVFSEVTDQIEEFCPANQSPTTPPTEPPVMTLSPSKEVSQCVIFFTLIKLVQHNLIHIFI